MSVPGTTVLTGMLWKRFIPGRDSYTKLLMHFDGADGSTTTADSSLTPKTGITITAPAALRTAVRKFGSASFQPGTASFQGGHATVPYSSDFDFGLPTLDFTIECWFYCLPGSSAQFISLVGGDAVGWEMNLNYPTWGTLGFWTPGVQRDLGWYPSQGSSIPANVWTHAAVTRWGNNFYGWINGQMTTNSPVFDNTVSIDLGGNDLVIGTQSTTDFIGYIDELRISKGIARWTANFTPPSLPYG